MSLSAEYEDVKAAIDRLERAGQHQARIWLIEAADAAQSHRSIGHPIFDNSNRETEPLFTPEESMAIFAAAKDALMPRLQTIKQALRAELG